MPQGWEWDETLFAGSAPFYERGRLPYPAGMHDAFADFAHLDGRPRLLDVGCGTGRVALALADLFHEVVGVDPDVGMLAEADRISREHRVANVRWLHGRAENLPGDLGRFRYATFAASFHWMDRDIVAARIFDLLEPGGAFVHVGGAEVRTPPPNVAPPHPPPPRDAVAALVQRYLGRERRAGQGVLRQGTPGREWAVLRRAGFRPPEVTLVPGGDVVTHTIDDEVAAVFSMSQSAPHLFGDLVSEFERELRTLLDGAGDDGRFCLQVPDVALVFYRRP